MASYSYFFENDLAILVDSDEKARLLTSDLEEMGAVRPHHCPLPLSNIMAVVVRKCGTLGLLFNNMDIPPHLDHPKVLTIDEWYGQPNAARTEYLVRWRHHAKQIERSKRLSAKMLSLAESPLSTLTERQIYELEKVLDDCGNTLKTINN
jgi:hypothetical protein